MYQYLSCASFLALLAIFLSLFIGPGFYRKLNVYKTWVNVVHSLYQCFLDYSVKYFANLQMASSIWGIEVAVISEQHRANQITTRRNQVR